MIKRDAIKNDALACDGVVSLHNGVSGRVSGKPGGEVKSENAPNRTPLPLPPRGPKRVDFDQKKKWFTKNFSCRCRLGFSLTAWFDEKQFPERDKKGQMPRNAAQYRETLLQWLYSRRNFPQPFAVPKKGVYFLSAFGAPIRRGVPLRAHRAREVAWNPTGPRCCPAPRSTTSS